MKFRVLQNAGNLLSNWETVRFSRSVHLCTVSWLNCVLLLGSFLNSCLWHLHQLCGIMREFKHCGLRIADSTVAVWQFSHGEVVFIICWCHQQLWNMWIFIVLKVAFFVYQRFGGHSAFIFRVGVSFSTHKTALYHNLQGLSLIKPFHKNLKSCMFHLFCANGTCYSVCWQPKSAFLAIPMCSMCLKWVTLKLLFKKIQTSETFIQYQYP